MELVKQCLLSLFIFNLTLESLSCFIKQYKGILVTKMARVEHKLLYYADDISRLIDNYIF